MFSFKKLFNIPEKSEVEVNQQDSEVQKEQIPQDSLQGSEALSNEASGLASAEQEGHAANEQSNATDSDAAAKAIQKKISKMSREGYQYLKEDKLSEALEAFEQILEEDPENHYALVGIGDIQRKKRNFTHAIHYYNRCLAVQANNNYALFGLADSFRSLKKYNKAIKIWEEYLHQDTENVTVLTRIADGYRRMNDFDQATQVYKNVLGIDPENVYALTGLGHLHYNLHNYNESLKFWTQIYESKGNDTDIRVLTSIGNCHRKLKSFPEGTNYFEEALKKEENNFYALYGIADCFRGMQKPEQSLEYWNRLLDKDPENKVILTRAGDAYRLTQELERAENYYKRALNIKYDPYAVLGLAIMRVDSRNYAEAASQLERLIDRNPKLFRAYPLLSECYLKLDEHNRVFVLIDKFQSQITRHTASDIVKHMDKIRARLP